MSEINLEAVTSNVYVFNCYNEAIGLLQVQYGDAGTIAGYSNGVTPNPPLYTPSSKAVPRSKSLAGGKFGIGDNIVSAQWDSFTANFTLPIADPAISHVSLTDDLVLFVMVNQAVLVTTGGFVLTTVDYQPVDAKGERVSLD